MCGCARFRPLGKAQQGRSGQLFPRLQDFIGKWHITRRIAHADGATAQFEGRAVFTPEGDDLRYHESGDLRLASGQSMRAERDYVWSASEGGQLEVFFEDRRPFHHITKGPAQAEHWCDPDMYKVRYDFGQWPHWTAEWRVKGPRKDYCMTSHYHRGSEPR